MSRGRPNRALRSHRPIGERGDVTLHPNVLSVALATPSEQTRLLEPVLAELLGRREQGTEEAVAWGNDEDLAPTITL